MSTNFYLRRQDTDFTTRDEHIGKRAGGWVFQFQGKNFSTFTAWVNRLANLGDLEFIADEYGTQYTFQEFYKAVWQTIEPWGSNKIVPQVPPFTPQEVWEKSGDKGRCWMSDNFIFVRHDFS